MARKIVMFLGPPRGSGQRQALRFQFGNYVTKPTRTLGVALFRWQCTEHAIPDEVVVLGTRRSDWDLLHELAAVPYHMAAWQKLGLRDHIDQGRLDQRILDEASAFLTQFLGGLSVRCVLLPEGTGASTQLGFFEVVAAHVERGDTLHVDVSHDPWAAGLFASVSSSFLSQAGGVEIEALYIADFASSTMAGTPVLIITRINELIEWSNAIAMFRQSGLIGRLPELFLEDEPELAGAIRELNFAVSTFRYATVYDAFKRVNERLEALMTGPTRTVTALFARQLHAEAFWIGTSHLADWQLEFARRALYSGDYVRATILTQEAVFSAAIERERDRIDQTHRDKVAAWLRASRGRQDLFPVDPWPFIQLYDVREALVGSSTDPAVRQIVFTEKQLHDYLERAISFASVLVARFKRTPPK